MAVKHIDYFLAICDCCGRENAERINDIPMDWGMIVSHNADSHCEEFTYRVSDDNGEPISFSAIMTTGYTDFALCPDCYKKVIEFIHELSK